MVFKSLRRALGVGGPTVDTVLDGPDVQPGGYVSGQVRFAGGKHEVEVERIVVALQTRVEVEGADSEYDATVEFQRQQLTGGFRLGPGQQHAVPFQLPVPWETPITHVYGQRLPGMTMGVRTELAVAGALDKGDLDAIDVHPLPVQGASSTRSCGSASGSRPPTWSAATSTGCTRRCRSTRRSSSTRPPVRRPHQRGRGHLRHRPARHDGDHRVRQARRIHHRRTRRDQPVPGRTCAGSGRQLAGAGRRLGPSGDRTTGLAFLKARHRPVP